RRAVQVAVRVAEAHEVEGGTTRQLLVTRLEVDGRVPVRTAPVVEVAAVDVHPDAAEGVDDLLEPVEVDRDQVVDREAGQLLDREQTADSAAEVVGGVDLVQPVI